LSAAQLRAVLVGTASFLGDCLTPVEGSKYSVDPVLCFVAPSQAGDDARALSGPAGILLAAGAGGLS
jgi:hypothetical protein